jgi:hypothetical protein
MKRARVRVARVMAMAMRVAGDEEGKGTKVMVMATRVVGERTLTNGNKEGNVDGDKGGGQGRGE